MFRSLETMFRFCLTICLFSGKYRTTPHAHNVQTAGDNVQINVQILENLVQTAGDNVQTPGDNVQINVQHVHISGWWRFAGCIEPILRCHTRFRCFFSDHSKVMKVSRFK